MLRIKLSTSFPDWPLLRQTPGSSGLWGNVQFVVNEAVETCDGWVVYEDVTQPERSISPPEATLLITAECSAIHAYDPRFTSQFGAVRTSQTTLHHAHKTFEQQGYPWHIGVDRSRDNAAVYDYDQFSTMLPPPKPKAMSVICSNQDRTPAHRQRLRFAKQLQQELGDRIDFFGKAFRPMDDKWEAIAPYRYHVVLENDDAGHYWTEKLSDAYLGFALPVYFGCCNIDRYFPATAMERINVFKPQEAITRIARLLDQDSYQQRLDQVLEARKLVLERYNLFAVLAEHFENLYKKEALSTSLSLPQEIEILPHKRWNRSWSYRLRKHWGRMQHRFSPRWRAA